jgi:hypothetical protein
MLAINRLSQTNGGEGNESGEWKPYLQTTVVLELSQPPGNDFFNTLHRQGRRQSVGLCAKLHKLVMHIREL